MKTSDIQVSLVDHMGSDLSVVNAARVSFHKESEWANEDAKYADFADGLWRGVHPEFKGVLTIQDTKLINYLAKHKHFSPFNHAFITMRVKAPIFVARQLVKHKFMPWNEVSRRYVDDEPEFYFPDVFRAKAENVKQGSSDRAVRIIDDDGYNIVEHSTYCANELYKDLIHQGVAPEQARMVLPQNMMTEWIWSGTLGAYCDMLRLRLDPHTQYESRIVAEKIHEIIKPLFPVSVSALLEAK